MRQIKLIERVCTCCDGNGVVDNGDDWTGFFEEECRNCGGAGTVYDHKGLARNGYTVLEGVAS